MKITKLQREVANIASSSTVREELACVLHNGSVTVATDTFSLIEMTADKIDADKPTLINAKSLLKTKIKTEATIEGNTLIAEDGQYILATEKDADRYPRYEEFFSKQDGDYVELTINGEYLAEVSKILSKLDDFKKVTLRINKIEKHQAIEFRAKGQDHTARALLMPINT